MNELVLARAEIEELRKANEVLRTERDRTILDNGALRSKYDALCTRFDAVRHYRAK